MVKIYQPGVKSPSLTLVQTVGYSNHFFGTLAFGSDKDYAITIPAMVQQIILSPTVDAYIELDTPTQPTNTPSVLANQSIAAAVQVTVIHVRGVAAAGTLKVWCFW